MHSFGTWSPTPRAHSTFFVFMARRPCTLQPCVPSTKHRAQVVVAQPCNAKLHTWGGHGRSVPTIGAAFQPNNQRPPPARQRQRAVHRLQVVAGSAMVCVRAHPVANAALQPPTPGRRVGRAQLARLGGSFHVCSWRILNNNKPGGGRGNVQRVVYLLTAIQTHQCHGQPRWRHIKHLKLLCTRLLAWMAGCPGARPLGHRRRGTHMLHTTAARRPLLPHSPASPVAIITEAAGPRAALPPTSRDDVSPPPRPWRPVSLARRVAHPTVANVVRP